MIGLNFLKDYSLNDMLKFSNSIKANGREGVSIRYQCHPGYATTYYKINESLFVMLGDTHMIFRDEYSINTAYQIIDL